LQLKEYLAEMKSSPEEIKAVEGNAFSSKDFIKKPLFYSLKMVGTAGFEPTTPTPPVWCATWLRYAPILNIALISVPASMCMGAARDRHNTGNHW
jgi:hypothetical protein